MPSYVEVWKAEGAQLLPLEAERVTVGAHPDADVVIDSDRTVSRLHAVLERFAAGWVIRDLGSANGTFVNGERLAADRTLRPGDEVRVGRTRLLLRDPSSSSHPATERAQPPPPLTARERDVLVELCRPVPSAWVTSGPRTARRRADRQRQPTSQPGRGATGRPGSPWDE